MLIGEELHRNRGGTWCPTRTTHQELFRRYVNSRSGGQPRSWLYTVLAVVIVYVMLDVGYPRPASIHLKSADHC